MENNLDGYYIDGEYVSRSGSIHLVRVVRYGIV